MIIINPNRNGLEQFDNPWLHCHSFTGKHETVSIRVETALSESLYGYIELQVRTFKNNIYMGELIDSYSRIYRLNNLTQYVYEFKNTTGLDCELWVRFKSRITYNLDIFLNKVDVNVIEELSVGISDEMISILRLDNNWIADGWGYTFHPYYRSNKNGEFDTGSIEFGYYTPLPIHNHLSLALSGGLLSDPTMKLIEFLSESDTVLASYNFTVLQGNPRLVNENHIHHKFNIPLHTSKERFKVRLTDNDNAGEGGWSWFSVSPEMCLLSV